MITVECPRCGQPWYSEERVRGRERLCEKCQDYFRRKRGGGEPFTVTPFMIAVLVFVGIEAILIGLAYLWPDTFVKVLVGYGFVLLVVTLVMLRSRPVRIRASDEDWDFPWWTVLIGLAALVSLTTGFSIQKKVAQPPAAQKNESPDSRRAAPDGRPGGGLGPPAPADAPAADRVPSR